MYWDLVGRGQGCCQTSYNAQDSPPITKNYPGQNVYSAEVEKTWAGARTAVRSSLQVPNSSDQAKGLILFPRPRDGSKGSLFKLVMGLHACASRTALLFGWSPNKDVPQQCPQCRANSSRQEWGQTRTHLCTLNWGPKKIKVFKQSSLGIVCGERGGRRQ